MYICYGVLENNVYTSVNSPNLTVSSSFKHFHKHFSLTQTRDELISFV